jgi:hypothetical protein
MLSDPDLCGCIRHRHSLSLQEPACSNNVVSARHGTHMKLGTYMCIYTYIHICACVLLLAIYCMPCSCALKKHACIQGCSWAGSTYSRCQAGRQHTVVTCLLQRAEATCQCQRCSTDNSCRKLYTCEAALPPEMHSCCNASWVAGPATRCGRMSNASDQVAPAATSSAQNTM